MNSNVSFPESDCSDSELEVVSSLSDDIVSSSSLPTSLALSQTDRQRRSGIGVLKLGFFSGRLEESDAIAKLGFRV